jgi:hypothetical protein
MAARVETVTLGLDMRGSVVSGQCRVCGSRLLNPIQRDASELYAISYYKPAVAVYDLALRDQRTITRRSEASPR